jgi:hypothetical protein
VNGIPKVEMLIAPAGQNINSPQHFQFFTSPFGAKYKYHNVISSLPQGDLKSKKPKVFDFHAAGAAIEWTKRWKKMALEIIGNNKMACLTKAALQTNAHLWSLSQSVAARRRRKSETFS